MGSYVHTLESHVGPIIFKLDPHGTSWLDTFTKLPPSHTTIPGSFWVQLIFIQITIKASQMCRHPKFYLCNTWQHHKTPKCVTPQDALTASSGPLNTRCLVKLNFSSTKTTLKWKCRNFWTIYYQLNSAHSRLLLVGLQLFVYLCTIARDT